MKVVEEFLGEKVALHWQVKKKKILGWTSEIVRRWKQDYRLHSVIITSKKERGYIYNYIEMACKHTSYYKEGVL